MKKGKLTVLLLTILFIAIAVVFGRNEIGSRNFPFSVIVTADGAEEEIFCMKIADAYYMFLPSYVNEQNAKIRTNFLYDVSIDGQRLKKDQSCLDFPLNTELELYFRSGNNEGYEAFTFVKSDQVATMYLDVPSGNMDYIHEKKGNAEPASIRLYTEDGHLDFCGEAESFNGRGNGTWEADKKAYSLKLLDEADLLGMGNARRWILLSNSYDSSHVRNKVAYEMAAAVGAPFTPEVQWMDLYLNGEYAGLYLLSERNEVHPERVNIDADRSFLVSVEPDWRLALQGYPYVQTESGTAFRIHHGTLPSETMQKIWQSAENAIFAEDGYDTATGKRWDELIDVDSWAQKYLLEEVLANSDVGLASEFFFYEETNGVIYAGPIWDMDISLKDSEEPWLSTRAIIAGRPHLTDLTDRNYFYELLQKPAFYDRVKELYRTEFRPLLVQLLDGGLEVYSDKALPAALANQVRWQERDPEAGYQEIREFLQKRMAFLDACWLDGEVYFLVQVEQPNRVWAFAVFPGETLDFLPEPDSGTWYKSGTEEVLNRSLPVTSDLVIYGKNETPS